MIAHGAEIIRWTFSLRWKCGHANCFEGEALEESKSDCELMQRMVRRGLWYICCAGADVLEFSQPRNWARLQAAREEGFWLLDLFL
jgi:hypothetical protein